MDYFFCFVLGCFVGYLIGSADGFAQGLELASIARGLPGY